MIIIFGKGFLVIDNNVFLIKSCMYYNKLNLVNDLFLLFIKIFGGVDIFIFFFYIDVCMYVR